MDPAVDWGDAEAIRAALRHTGGLRLRHPRFPAERLAEALHLAAEFFALPAAEKEALAIERSPHFRGYSQLRNERDWREQIHFGRELPAAPGLEGPNLWPPAARWRSRLLRLLADLEATAAELLGLLEPSLPGAPGAPYILLKLIHYLPPPGAAPRSGVAPHVDFSWLTLLIQDAAGGLATRDREGKWHPVPTAPGELIVHAGELLQFATGGEYPAAPHRVDRPAGAGPRLSLPFFFNPPLGALVAGRGSANEPGYPDHIHRVLDPAASGWLDFAAAEWARKGLGHWCRECRSAAPGITPATTAGAAKTAPYPGR